MIHAFLIRFFWISTLILHHSESIFCYMIRISFFLLCVAWVTLARWVLCMLPAKYWKLVNNLLKIVKKIVALSYYQVVFLRRQLLARSRFLFGGWFFSRISGNSLRSSLCAHASSWKGLPAAEFPIIWISSTLALHGNTFGLSSPLIRWRCLKWAFHWIFTNEKVHFYFPISWRLVLRSAPLIHLILLEIWSDSSSDVTRKSRSYSWRQSRTEPIWFEDIYVWESKIF